MNKLVFIGLILVLSFNAKSQESNLTFYSTREITLEKVQRLQKYELPACFFIQTLNEYQEIFCMGRKSEVFFNREFVLGVKALNNIIQYETFIEKETNIIHVFVYSITHKYIYVSQQFHPKYTENKPYQGTNLIWLAIPKPSGNYGIQVHFTHNDVNKETITEITKILKEI